MRKLTTPMHMRARTHTNVVRSHVFFNSDKNCFLSLWTMESVTVIQLYFFYKKASSDNTYIMEELFSLRSYL